MALPAPPKEEPVVDLNATGDNVVPNCNSIVEIAIERVASREQSRPQSKAWILEPFIKTIRTLVRFSTIPQIGTVRGTMIKGRLTCVRGRRS